MKANKDRLYSDTKFLTELRPYRNHLNMESLDKVVDFMKEVMIESGLSVKEQKWKVNEKEYTNVIAVYNTGQNRTLVVGAHYDVFGEKPGADDNASAVAGLLETARLLGENKPEIDYSIELVGYCLEEPPYYGTEYMGSHIHAQSLYKNQVDVIGMICYEMIGYFSDKPNSQKFPSPELSEIYPNTGNFIMTVGIDKYDNFNKKVRQLMSEASDIAVYNISIPTNHQLISIAELSDHVNYWKFGYNALMINDTSDLRNPNYHKQTDTIETLNFDKMTEVVNGAYNAITKII